MYPLVPEEVVSSAAQLAVFFFTVLTTVAGFFWGPRV